MMYVDRSLRVAGPTRMPSSAVQTYADAYLGGDVQGILLVAGTLHLAPSSVDALAIISATTIVHEPVTVNPPCDCGASIDIPAALADVAAHNDNAAAGWGPDQLASVDTTTVVDIPCGRYALSSIHAQQALFLAVHGRALVAVAGDVAINFGLSVTLLDQNAELDLLIGGQLTTSGANQVDSSSPARFRIWLPGSKPIVFNDRPSIGATIHAPNAAVTAPAGLVVSGALFARSLTSGGETDLHFDQAIFSSGVNCGEPATPSVP
jgi:hypothetical protein